MQLFGEAEPAIRDEAIAAIEARTERLYWKRDEVFHPGVGQARAEAINVLAEALRAAAAGKPYDDDALGLPLGGTLSLSEWKAFDEEDRAADAAADVGGEA